MTDPPRVLSQSESLSLDSLRRQRDMLLAACQRLAAACQQVRMTPPGYQPDWATLYRAEQQARAAINMATGQRD